MTTTDEAPAVTPDAAGADLTPHLNAALARVQAEMPDVAKSNLATIPGKEGRAGYKYDYADLTDCSKAILPLLGKNGLAFTARPTMLANGAFVLAYALVHESGERDSGIYPLHVNGSPQAIGGEITYARRYSLCAITGLAPGGDDDDAQTAQAEARENRASGGSSYDPWETAVPAPPRNGRPQSSGQGAGRPAKPADAVQITPLDPEDPWSSKVEEITTEEDGRAAFREVTALHKAGSIDRERATRLQAVITARTTSIALQAGATPDAAGSDVRSAAAGEAAPGPSDDAEWVKDFYTALAEAASAEEVTRMQRSIGQAIGSRKIGPEMANMLTATCQARRGELAGAQA